MRRIFSVLLFFLLVIPFVVSPLSLLPGGRGELNRGYGENSGK